MINSILRANNWYDTLKEPNRTLFFFFVLIPLICGSQILLTTFLGDIGYIYWAFWILIMVLFRMTPSIVGIKNLHKERKNSKKDFLDN